MSSKFPTELQQEHFLEQIGAITIQDILDKEKLPANLSGVLVILTSGNTFCKIQNHHESLDPLFCSLCSSIAAHYIQDNDMNAHFNPKLSESITTEYLNMLKALKRRDATVANLKHEMKIGNDTIIREHDKAKFWKTISLYLITVLIIQIPLLAYFILH